MNFDEIFDFRAMVFVFLCDFSAWVTRPESPKGVKDEVKQAQRAANLKSGPRGAPRLLVDYNICVTLVSTYIDDIVCRVEVIQIDKDTEIGDW